jgi:hypothetical protein
VPRFNKSSGRSRGAAGCIALGKSQFTITLATNGRLVECNFLGKRPHCAVASCRGYAALARIRTATQ